jgi:hypothetical protein
VIALSLRRLWVHQRQTNSNDRLYGLLNDHIPEDIPPRDMIPLEHLCGRVQSVLREQVELVNEMKDHGHGPICDHRQSQRKVCVVDPWDERRQRFEGVIGKRRQGVGCRCVGHIWYGWL